MKVNYIQSLVAISISTIIAYGFFYLNNTTNKLLLCGGSFVFTAITLLLTFGINSNYTRTSTMIRTLSVIFFMIALISNFIFSLTNFSVPIYIVINGILVLIYISVGYSISRTKQ